MNRDHKSGFTIIELMLAMTFVSTLLIAIAMTVIEISNIYNRGMTLKSVNQLGRSLTTDIQRTVGSSSQFDVTVGNDYIKQEYNSKNFGGRLCMGQYSFVWNYGYALDAEDMSTRINQYTDGEALRFVKVVDQGYTYCDYNVSLYGANGYKMVDKTNAIELIDTKEYNFVLHSFNISLSANDTKSKQSLYSIRFNVGTNDQNALKTDDTTGMVICKTAGESGADPSYCSTNYFDIVVRAGNAVE